jgi:hypothetical protein
MAPRVESTDHTPPLSDFHTHTVKSNEEDSRQKSVREVGVCVRAPQLTELTLS